MNDAAEGKTGAPTPGPWSVESHGNTTALYSGRGNNRHGLRLMNLDDGDGNFEANARLIAAVPDLMAAGKELFANAALFNRDTDAMWCFVRDQWLNALAKAEGRTP